MFEFLKIQYTLGKINAEKLQICVTKGYITQEQFDNIVGGTE